MNGVVASAMLKIGRSAILLGVILITFGGCNSDDGDAGASCILGEFGCECNTGTCLGALVCMNNICVNPDGDGDGDGDGDPGDGDPGDGDPGDGDPGDGDPGDGDGDACGVDESLCGGACTNTMDDNMNCGSCGNACDTTGNLGGCSAGVCEPALTECIPADNPPKSCNEICSELGKSCISQGCGGSTFMWYGSPNTCEQFLGDSNENDCTEPTTWSAAYYRCCCQEL
jgi:hypothetical protein